MIESFIYLLFSYSIFLRYPFRQSSDLSLQGLIRLSSSFIKFTDIDLLLFEVCGDTFG